MYYLLMLQFFLAALSLFLVRQAILSKGNPPMDLNRGSL